MSQKRIQIKIKYGQQTEKIEISKTTTFKEVKIEIKKKFNISLGAQLKILNATTCVELETEYDSSTLNDLFIDEEDILEIMSVDISIKVSIMEKGNYEWVVRSPITASELISLVKSKIPDLNLSSILYGGKELSESNELVHLKSEIPLIISVHKILKNEIQETQTINERIFSEIKDPTKEIKVSTDPKIQVNNAKLQEIFGPNFNQQDFEFKRKRTNELKKIYQNNMQSEANQTLPQRIEKIQQTVFDAQNTNRNNELKLLASVLIQSWNDSGIGASINPNKESNLKTIDTLPESAVIVELQFDESFLGKSFEEFSKDPAKQQEIEFLIQKFISECTETPLEEVAIVKMQKGSAFISAIIPPHILQRLSATEINFQDKIIALKKKLNQFAMMKFPKLKKLDAVLQTIQTNITISPGDFDPRGDITFSSVGGDVQRRGPFPYYQPGKGWKRFGLKVLGLYDDDKWITMDNSPTEWAVAFHGTNLGGEKGFESILKSRTVVQGVANAYGGDKATNRSDPIPRVGIYFAQNIEQCYKMPTTINGKKYEVAFQCRIHPQHIWETGNGLTWIVVDSPIYVRPYGIVLKEK